MKNNFGILNCFNKEVYFKFEDKLFTVNLTDGDLEDSWNSIAFSDKTSYDVNFFWDESHNPSLTLYGLVYDETTDTYNVNTKDSYPISIVQTFGDKADYFGTEFNPNRGQINYKVYANGKLVKRTKSLSSASDLSVTLSMIEKQNDVHFVGVDEDGGTMLLTVEDKFIDSANIKLNQFK